MNVRTGELDTSASTESQREFIAKLGLVANFSLENSNFSLSGY
jgi:hypothetical protein